MFNGEVGTLSEVSLVHLAPISVFRNDDVLPRPLVAFVVVRSEQSLTPAVAFAERLGVALEVSVV